MNWTFMARHATTGRASCLEDFGRDTFQAVIYREFRARPELADLVACSWERGRAPEDGDAIQRVVPDACVDLVWRESRLWTAGPDTTAVMSPVEAGATVVGLRFRTGVAGSALGLPASALRDIRVPLEDVWGRAGAELAERVGSAATAHERRQLLEDTVLRRRATIDDPDEIVLAACRLLGRPGSRVQSVSHALATSERQLRRRFRDAVGYGPKTYDRVVRFQRFLARCRAHDADGWSLAAAAAELGYADQAHLTRECVELSGLTPTALARAG
jgi:AraC-like DNA-binding protein